MFRRKYTEIYHFLESINRRLDNGKRITFKLNFIDSSTFVSTSLSKLVKYLPERLYNNKCTDCKSKLGYVYFKDDQLIFRRFECKKN